MPHYERRLPHWNIVGHPLFATFRLHGSLPVSRIFPPERITTGKAFVAMDRMLDTARCRPRYLQRADIAEMVTQALRSGESRFHRYELHSFVIMPNHVHLLATPRVVAADWLGPLKEFTAHEANRILGRRGKFWQDESFDRLVRSDAEFERIRGYIEWNPVRAGLVAAAEEFPWSSACGR